MIKILDRYLIRRFLQTLLLVIVALGLTIVIINMVEGLRDFVDHKVPLGTIALYYLYFAGWIIKTFMPMFILLAVLFTVAMLARRNEILAMKASGLSLYRLTAPFLVVVTIIAGAHFYFNEYIFPPANKRRVEISEFVIKARSRKVRQVARNIYRQIRPGYFYTIGRLDIPQRKGKDFKLYQTEKHQLVRLVTAKEVVYRDFMWVAHDGLVRRFENGVQVSFVRFPVMQLPDIKDKPKDFEKRIGQVQEMSLNELREYVDLMKRTGGPYLRELVTMKIKYAYPLASIIVVLICVPFAASPRRGAIAVSFAAGTGIALVYFVLFRIMQSAAYNERIPIEVGVWGVDVLFFIVGVILMLKARK